MKSFEEVKKLYNTQIIKLKDVDTKDKTSGIYLMYIEDIDKNDYIPLYIGKSANIYTRKSGHKTKIKKFFLLEDEIYNKRIPLFSGNYLYCKIVSTLKNNNKTMDNIKFKVLEYCDKTILDEKEQYWISYYESTIYGFNQFQEIIDSNNIMASLIYNSKENKNWNEIATYGKNTLLKFEDKLDHFDKSLSKYKYYQVNYTLLLGNFYNLYQAMDTIDTKHFIELDDDLNQELSDLLEELDYKIKLYLTVFKKKGFILDNDELFNKLAINN